MAVGALVFFTLYDTSIQDCGFGGRTGTEIVHLLRWRGEGQGWDPPSGLRTPSRDQMELAKRAREQEIRRLGLSGWSVEIRGDKLVHRFPGHPMYDLVRPMSGHEDMNNFESTVVSTCEYIEHG